MNLRDLLLPYQKTFVDATQKNKIWVASRQVGKSFSVAYLAAQKSLEKNGNLVLLISLGARAANELLKKCGQMAQAVKIITDGRITYEQTADTIKFSNGSRILSLPSGNIEGLRSWTSVCTIIDEAAFISNLGEVLQAIVPTLTRQRDGQLILTTTPAGRNGDFYQLLQDALDDPTWYVQTTTIHDAISDGLNVDIDQLHSVCKDPDVFAQEYECQFSRESGSFLDTSLLQFYQFDGTIKSGYYCGIDFGYKNDSTAISILRQETKNTYLENVISLVGKDFSEQYNVIKELHEKYHFLGGYCDQNGIGAAISEQINKNICALIRGYTTTSSNKTPNYEYLRNEIFNRRFFVNSSLRDTVIADFCNIRKEVSETGKISYVAGRKYGSHSDITSSIVLGMQAIREKPVVTSLPQTWMRISSYGYPSRRHI